MTQPEVEIRILEGYRERDKYRVHLDPHNQGQIRDELHTWLDTKPHRIDREHWHKYIAMVPGSPYREVRA
jgi:hypothetical protein